MSERKGTKGLELWCRRMTEGYPGVNVTNMTTSWRDGLAFCAIIHHFRPDLIEFSKLNKDDIFYNNELAFNVAERHLGIPALLEPEDMVEYSVPDRLSILTYLSQFYQTFVVSQGKSSARIAPKRSSTSPEHGLVSSPSTSPPSKVAFASAGRIRREPCAKCGLPVFIAERLNVGKQLYHRTCFRCARCTSQLTLANYYETEQNQFCCEMCPDEEKNVASVLTQSLSDEEKSASLTKQQENDEYSTNFESALEYSSLKKTTSTLSNSQYKEARSFFISSQVGENDSGNEEEPPDLPKSKPPPVVVVVLGDETTFSDSGFPTTIVNKQSSLVSASGKLEKSHDIVTKDTISAEGNTNSLVKARMRLFETKSDHDDASNETHSINTEVPSNDDSINVQTEVGEKKSEIEDNTSIKIEETAIKSEEINDHDDNTSSSSIKIEETAIKSEEINDHDDNTPSSSIKIEETAIKSEETNDHDDNKPSSSIKIEETAINTQKTIDDDDDDNLQSSSIKIEESAIITDDNITSPPKNVPSLIQLSDKSSEQTSPSDVKLPLSPDPPIEEYPDDLNPFGDDEEPPANQIPKKLDNSTISSNPFEDEEEEYISVLPSPKPAIRKKLLLTKKIPSPANPFEDDEDDVVEKPPEPAKRQVIRAPRISLNPFWSDNDDDDEDDKPVPKPRTSKTSSETPGESSLSNFGSLSSIASSQSARKKKAAPKPPSIWSGPESGHSSLTSSPSPSVNQSPRATPKLRKGKKAPPPPTSTPMGKAQMPNFIIADEFEKEKNAKDQQNRNRQSQNLSLQSPSSSENSATLGAPDKSTYGKWKRNKGRAPTRPIPQRRLISTLPLAEIRRELEVIEIQQQGLEKQGVRLEQIIRDKCEKPDVTPEESLPPEIEEMVLQLFELVNEKNELFRKQAELMYLRRQQKLEEEHADLEFQIRCLMVQPEANKTDSDKAREEELINRLVEVVERRNEIIECLEMDRVREAEEDNSINNQLNLYTLKKDEDQTSLKKKEKKKHKKEKKHKIKGHKVDADKDVDESEGSTSLVKEKKKKKFNIF